MKNYKNNLLGALYMLKTVMVEYDTEIAHNILINGGSNQTEDEMEEDLANYIEVLEELINETWHLPGDPMLISMKGKKLSK